jgi:hypothetical protein
MDAGDLEVLAENELASPAVIAGKVVSAVPPHAHMLARLPLRHSRPHCIYVTADFMAWNPGIGQSGEAALLGKHITMTNPAGLYLDPDLARTGLGNLSFHQFKRTTGFGNLCDFHACHDCSSLDSAVAGGPWEIVCADDEQ